MKIKNIIYMVVNSSDQLEELGYSIKYCYYYNSNQDAHASEEITLSVAQEFDIT